MPEHDPRSDPRPTALLNSPCYLLNSKHETVYFICCLHFRSSVLCYIPHYSPANTHFLIPAPTLFSILLWELFPTRLPQVANLTHARELVPRPAACAGQADLIQSQLRTMPAASWSSTSGSAVLFRFGYWIHFKNQLLNFSLSSKTILISLEHSIQTYFPLAFLSGSKQSWCCCRENLLADLLPWRTAGEVLC